MSTEGFSSPFGSRLTLSALRREFASMFASLEELQWHIRPELEYRIQQLFGDRSLRVLALAVEVTELYRAGSTTDLAGEVRSDVRMGRPVFPAAGDIDFNKVLSDRAENLLSSCQNPPLDTHVRAGMTDRLRECAFHIHPTIHPQLGIDVRRSFLSVVCAYRHSDPEIFNAIADVSSRFFNQRDTLPDRCHIEEMKQEIATMHAEAEELLLSYPFTLRHRLDDPQWVEGERQRLDTEIARLVAQKDALE